MKRIYIIFFIIIFISTIYFFNISKFNSGFVSNVIDGDTIELSNGVKVRLYGINTPESNEYYFSDATNYLKGKVENKKIKYKEFGKDQYNRTLAFIYLDDENVNLNLVENGYATPFFMYKDSYYNDFILAFENCLINDVGLCKKSLDVCTPCIKLKELNYDAVGDDNENVNGEFFILENVCDYDCNLNDWLVKDSTSKNRFRLQNVIIKSNSETTFHSGSGLNTNDVYFLCSSKKCTPIWNNDYDSFYLRSGDGGLIIFYSYVS